MARKNLSQEILGKGLEDAESIAVEEEPEGNGHAPKAVRRRPQKVTASDEALKDLIKFIRSLNLDDLKQLTYLPIKLTDPMAKGVAYYDGTLKSLTEEAGELLNWYIEKCKKDIYRYEQMEEPEVAAPAPAAAAPSQRRGLFKKKVVIVSSPEITPYSPAGRVGMLRKRLAELESLKAEWETNPIDVEESFFVKWIRNYCLLARSQDGKQMGVIAPLTQDQMYAGQTDKLNPNKIFNL